MKSQFRRHRKKSWHKGHCLPREPSFSRDPRIFLQPSGFIKNSRHPKLFLNTYKPIESLPSTRRNPTSSSTAADFLPPSSTGAPSSKPTVSKDLASPSTVTWAWSPSTEVPKGNFGLFIARSAYMVGFSVHTMEVNLDAGDLLWRQEMPASSTSPAQCRAEGLRKLAGAFRIYGSKPKRGEVQAVRQEGKVGLYSTPSLWQKLSYAWRSRSWV